MANLRAIREKHGSMMASQGAVRQAIARKLPILMRLPCYESDPHHRGLSFCFQMLWCCSASPYRPHLQTCGFFSTLPAVSSADAFNRAAPDEELSRVISHSAKLATTGLASLPLTTTRFTVPLSAVVPRTSTLPSGSL